MSRPSGSSRTLGFTLLEVLTVVVILAILVAVAVPYFLRGRVTANEAACLDALHLLCTAEMQYSVENNMQFTDLNTLFNGGYFLDDKLAAGQKSGYDYDLDASEGSAWHCFATPVDYNHTGVNTFFVDEGSVIRYKDNGGNQAPVAEAEAWPTID